jgi:uncharacterized protein
MALAETPDKVADELAIEVVYCASGSLFDSTALRLAAGSTALDAVQASGVLTRYALAGYGLPPLLLGIWGKRKDGQTLLRSGDRVEIYRPLKLTPMEARRLRHSKLRAGKVQKTA